MTKLEDSIEQCKNHNCQICDQNFELEKSKAVSYPSGSSQKAFQSIYFCPGCEVGMAYPKLTDQEIDALYTDGDYWKSTKDQRIVPKLFPGHYAMAECRLKFLKPFWAAGANVSILDVGAGHGFLGEVVLHDPAVFLKEYVVVEKDRHYRNALKGVWGKHSNVAFNAWEDIKDIKGEFDLIVVSHVIEHVNAPKDMLQWLGRFLKKDGLLLIDVPYQDYFFKDDVFPHVFFYNPSNLKRLLDRSGFKIAALGCFGQSRTWLSRSSIGSISKIFLENVVYKLRSILPLALTKKFFCWYLQGDRLNPDGAWIRAVLKKA